MEFLEKQFSLAGKVAIVTGGNTGIGLAYVDALSKAGADIMVTHFEPEIDHVRDLVQVENKRKVAFWKGDLTASWAPEEVVKTTIATLGRVDILVNNAGIQAHEPLLEHAWKKWDKVMNINLNVVFKMSQVVCREFVNWKSGKVINIASMRSFQGGLESPGYTASKHGVVGLTKAFANELAVHNVQINAIAPGFIRSNITKKSETDNSYYEERLKRIPTNRWGTPADLQGVVVFLASSASDYVNGAVVCVDGGVQAR